MCQLEAACARLNGARKGTLHVPEQLRLRESVGNGRGIERDEVLIVPRALVVNGTGDELLARAGFTLNENRAVHRCDELQRGEHRLHWRAAPHDVVELQAVLERGPELGIVLRELLLLERSPEDTGELG